MIQSQQKKQGKGKGPPGAEEEGKPGRAVQGEVFQLWWRPSPEGLQGVEGDEAETPLLGKLDACAPSPIWTGCRDEELYFIDDAVIEGDGARVSHHNNGQNEECKEKRKGKKKILGPQNLRYNHGKHKVLNYSMWSVRGQGQQIRTSWLGRLAWWMMQHSPTIPKGG